MPYVLQMIEGGADDVLVELARHVGFQLHATVSRVEPPFWRKDMLKLFVTHLAAHRHFGAELQGALLGYGISAFVAHK